LCADLKRICDANCRIAAENVQGRAAETGPLPPVDNTGTDEEYSKFLL